MNLGKNIQKNRRLLNLSQEELAEKCEVSRQAVTKWEMDESIPTIDKLIVLADIFDISLDELVGRIELTTYGKLKKTIENLVLDDIPKNSDDDACYMVARFILFGYEQEMDADTMIAGLKRIFLNE